MFGLLRTLKEQRKLLANIIFGGVLLHPMDPMLYPMQTYEIFFDKNKMYILFAEVACRRNIDWIENNICPAKS